MIDYLELFVPALLLNILAMLAGWSVSRALQLTTRNQFTISVEVGLQNSALAIFVSTTLLGSPAMAIVPVIYGSFSFFTTAFLGYGIKKLSSRSGRGRAVKTTHLRNSRNNQDG